MFRKKIDDNVKQITYIGAEGIPHEILRHIRLSEQ